MKEAVNIRNVEQRELLPAALGGDENKTIDLYILDEVNEISQMEVAEGEEYRKDLEGIWLDAVFAQDNEYKLHENIKLDINGQTLEKEIIGLCYSPEYIYNIKEGELVPDHKNSGFAFINDSSMKDFPALPVHQILLSGSGDLKESVDRILGTEGFSMILQKDHPSYSMIRDEITQHKEIGLIFVSVFLLIALLITITTVHRILNSQRMQIGILKALGFRKRQLYLHYVSHSTFVCFLGSAAGWCLGYMTLPGLLFPIMKEMYILPELKPAVTQGSWTLPVICAFFFLQTMEYTGHEQK